ncbi:MAG: DNA recombination/repair protein RecA [Anaerolineae bacterium]|nr:DNA recombination/repair protein RecA [Anaerolineae bacterium]
MASQQHSRYRRLELTVSQVQRQWGPRALQRLPQAVAPLPALPTGFAALDAAIGIGGFPRGQITELLGPATSGKTTLALIALARAQRCGGIGAYFDLGWTLDPEYARLCGVDLHRLLIIRPHSGAEALAIAVNLVRRRGLQLVVFDARPEAWLPADPGPERSLASGLRLLSAALAATPCVALFLTLHEAGQSLSSALDYPGRLPLPENAALRLSVTCERWIQRPWEDISGYTATIVVTKNRLGAPARQATISIALDGTAQGYSKTWSEDEP